MVEVKASGTFMQNGAPISLLEKWQQEDRNARAMLAQVGIARVRMPLLVHLCVTPTVPA